jgi:hypothetical protein
VRSVPFGKQRRRDAQALEKRLLAGDRAGELAADGVQPGNRE